MNKTPAVFIDVDGVLSVRKTGQAVGNVPIILWLRKNQKKVDVYLWSKEGGDHAEEIAHRLGIDQLITAIISKPKMIIVDEKSMREFTSKKIYTPTSERTEKKLAKLICKAPA